MNLIKVFLKREGIVTNWLNEMSFHAEYAIKLQNSFVFADLSNYTLQMVNR